MEYRKDFRIIVTESSYDAETFIRDKIAASNGEVEPFYAVNLNDICNKHVQWLTAMPRVKPFYAVKCNDDGNILRLLADLGANFDCASKAEIKKIMDLGVTADRIIYANPCKQSSYLRYAQEVGVKTMTFDNEHELIKIKQIYPESKLVLRMVTDDSNAVCRFSMKFGADMHTAPRLLQKARELEIDVVGISFHCGSGQMTSKAFVDAIQNARKMMNYGIELGFKMRLLDIGGGFPGNLDTEGHFSEIAQAVNRTLDEHFPVNCGVQIIAEPGRYYVASAYTLATNIIAQREMIDPATGEMKNMYFVNDGVYGSFNCILYDHYVPIPTLFSEDESNIKYPSSVWGPTCDGLDCIMPSVELPQLNIGNWILWKNMGAYTVSGAVEFNGLPFGEPHYFISKHFWNIVQGAFQTVAKKNQRKMPFFRLISGGDCSNEIEDDMLPWLPEDLTEESNMVAIQ